MINVFKNNIYIYKINYILIIILTFTMPYYISNSWIGTLSILIFLFTISNNDIRIKEIFKEKSFVFLFLFILFSISSFIWSDFNLNFIPEFKELLDNFKYYFLLIPALYFSNLTKHQSQFLFKVIAASPIFYIIIYYANAFNLLHIYSTHYESTGYKTLYVDLIANFFILISAIYFFIQIFKNLSEKKMQKTIGSILLFILISYSLIVDPLTSARSINLAYIVSIFLIPLYIFKQRIFILLPFMLLLLIFSIYKIKENQLQGISEIKNALLKKEFKGSLGYRLGLLIVGYELFKKDPFLGSGLTIRDKVIAFKKKDNHYFAGSYLTHFHNEHMMILTRTGLAGYLLFILFIYFFYKLKISSKEIHLLKNIFIISLLIIFFGEQYFSFKNTTNFIAILIGLFILTAKNNHSKHQ